MRENKGHAGYVRVSLQVIGYQSSNLIGDYGVVSFYRAYTLAVSNRCTVPSHSHVATLVEMLSASSSLCCGLLLPGSVGAVGENSFGYHHGSGLNVDTWGGERLWPTPGHVQNIKRHQVCQEHI